MNLTKKSFIFTACLGGLFFGGIGVFAYSPFDLWGITFLSAAAMVWFATLPHRKTALWAVFIWAVSYFAIGINWVHISMIQFGGVPELVSYLAVLLLAAYLALYPLLFAAVIQKLNLRSPWALAAVWTGTEYLRAVIFTGFPWLQFGYSLLDSPFNGIAPIFGVEGLSFFVLLISTQAVQIAQHFAKRTLKLKHCLSLSAFLLVAFSSQFIRWVDVDKTRPPISVSLVQGNIAQQLKWDSTYFDQTLQTYSRLIRESLDKSDVIILPESAIPATEQQIKPLLQHFDELARNQHTEIIIGTLYQSHQGVFNSAIVLGKDTPYDTETAPRFNKHHLVPFGEYVPFGSLFDWMREIFILPVNLSKGDFIQAPLSSANRQFNMAICYEIIFNDQVQQNQKAHNADYLLTISNDAWFGDSIGPEQHFQIARMRALELGKPLIRATNTGISAFVDPHGKVDAQAPQFVTTVLNRQVYPYQGYTPFSQIGNWGIYILSLLSFFIAWVKQKHTHR